MPELCARRPPFALAVPLLALLASTAGCASSQGDGSPGSGAAEDDGGSRTAAGDGGNPSSPDGGGIVLGDASITAPPPPDAQVDAGPPVDTSWTGRAPSMPLFVRNPYLSIWSGADSPSGAFPTLWNGATKGMVAIARVDGKSYLLTGTLSPSGITALNTAMQLVSRSLTPTKTEFVLGGGGVNVTMDFLSPVEPGDLKRQSAPLGYLTMTATSTDGASHAVSLYVDISGEWANGDSAQPVQWARETVSHTGGTLTVQSIASSSPNVLGQSNEYPQWGTAFVAADAPKMTVAIGSDVSLRNMAVTAGSLDGSNDTTMPRAISLNWPVLGFDFDLGSVGATSSPPVTLEVGLARDPAVSYQGTAVPPLWKSYWSTWEAMAADAYDDFAGAKSRANALDARIVSDAKASNGDHYSALCALSLRQAFGGTELVGTPTKPWLFLKEISSDGNISTVDVVYPASPVFLYTNPYLLKIMLDPLLEYAESGLWTPAFAEHDIGASYPVADGHNDGGGENMPVEESANMLLMMAAYTQRAKPADATAYATSHYTVAKKWADFLVANGLDPVGNNHFSTDDFSPAVDHNANLGLKGVLGVGAMGILAAAACNTVDATSYTSQSKSLMAQWVTKAAGTAGHTLFAYDQAGTWGLKYNAFYDKLLGMNLFPSTLMATDAAYYATQVLGFGVPLDSRFTTGTAGVAPWASKSDWQVWTAAVVNSPALVTSFIDGVYDYATTSTNRVPFSDYYDTKAGQQVGFQARPVQGGIFAFLALKGTSIVAQ